MIFHKYIPPVLQCCVAMLIGTTMSSAQQSPRFRILSHSDRSIEIAFQPQQYQTHPMTIDGKPAIQFRGGYATTAEPGAPQLPQAGTLIGLPPDGRPTLEIVEVQYSVEQGVSVAPVARERHPDSIRVEYHYDRNPSIYDRNSFYPDQVAVLGSPSWLRHQRMINLRIHPVQYNPVTGEIRRVSKLTVRVNFGRSAEQKAPIFQSAAVDPGFEDMYRVAILNASQARVWRVAPSVRVAVDSLRDWFTPYSLFAKISVTSDGIYSLRRDEIQNAGVPVGGIDPASLKIFYRGREIPILVHADSSGQLDSSSAIEFYGIRNRGTAGEFLSEYSDTNAYWLTWGNGNGARMTIAQSSDDSTAPPVPVFQSVRHFEQDLQYYAGIDDYNINDIRRVPSEGWYWADMYPGSAPQFQCDLPNVDQNTPALMRIHLGGMTGYFSTPDHRALVSVNGTPVGTVEFSGNRDTIAALPIPTRILLPGMNMVGVTSQSTASDPNQFYVDWFEIQAAFSFVASGDSLTFQSVSGPARYGIGGFSSRPMIFDLTSGRFLADAAVALEGGLFRVSFMTADNTPHTYLAIGESARKRPAGISQKIFKDIRATTTGADYIIITHRNFLPAAERLAQHRASFNKFRTAVIDIEDIYDEFNFGIFASEPVKSFVEYAYTRWTPPAPQDLVLFGDAIWDFRHIYTNTLKTNYVPSYGYPPTDNWYVSFDSSGIIPSIDEGRIPVETLSMAQDYVDKLIEYDGLPNGDWTKKFLFIAAGNTDVEKNSFNGQSMDLIERYVLPPPIAGSADTVFKRTDAVIDGEHKDRIRSILNDGRVFMNFIGHSGGRIWAVDAGDPSTLQNSGKYVFGSSVSCNVGFFADNRSNVYSEDFIFAPHAGAIAFWAGAGFSSYLIGNVVTDYFFSLMARDTIRDIGELTTLARLNLWMQYGPSDLITPGVNLYPLLGDPATHIAVPVLPDLSVSANDIHTLPAVPVASDSAVILSVDIRNLGLATADSVRVHATDLYQNVVWDLGTFVIPPVGRDDTLRFIWDVKGKAGSHLVSLTIDPLNRIEELRKDNNSASLSIIIAPTSLSPLAPLPYADIPAGAVLFRVTNPVNAPLTGLQFYFEVDTISTFSSPAKISSPAVAMGILATEWTSLPLQPAAYFWRARTFDGTSYGVWMNSAFTVSQTVSGGSYAWKQEFPGQGGENTYTAAVATDSGVVLARQESTRIYYRSLGGRENPDKDYYTIARINNQTITAYWYVIGGGFLVVDVDGATGNFTYRGYDNYSPDFPDSMVTYLQSIPADHYVMMGTISNGKTNVSEALYSEIEKLGSTDVRQVDTHDPWCYIGRVIPGGGVKIAEEHATADSAVVVYDIPNYYKTLSGNVRSVQVGPAKQWSGVSWHGIDHPGTSHLATCVLGERGSAVDTLFTSALADDSIDMRSVDARTYPTIRLLTTLGSSTGEETPRLLSWEVRYSPTGDLAIGSQTVQLSPDSVTTGDPVNIDLDVYNIGLGSIDSGKVQIVRSGSNNVPVLVDEKPIGRLVTSQSEKIRSVISTAGTTGRQRMRVVVQSLGTGDQYTFNNFWDLDYFVAGDSLPPHMRITFDGVRISNGDYVRPDPAILVTMDDNSDVHAADTSTVVITLDGVRVPYSANPLIQFVPLSSGGAQVLFRPALSDGEHVLSVDARDLAGNKADSTGSFSISFTVKSTPQLLNVINFPNPFSADTYFTFNYTGSLIPEEARIKIFTVAGRLIRSIAYHGNDLRVGFNRIPWDGRDEEGDEIANGVYLYILSVKAGDRTDQAKGSLAKIR